jgi:hypothetical protein
VDQTIALELAQKLIVFVIAICLMDPASLGARIDDLIEIQRVFRGPDNMAMLLISPMELWIKQLR